MESSAVARVFGIVELLEMILAHLPVKVGSRGRRSRAAHAQLPVLQLFQLRRVDRNWQGTIDGSLKLRQHMGLGGPIAAPPGPWQRWIEEQYAPLLWFLDIAGISIEFATETAIYKSETVRCQRDRPAHVHFWERLVCPRMSRALAASPNASWRGIRLSAVEDAPDIKFHLRIEEDYSHWRVHWQYRIQQGGTLGRFYDSFCRAIEDFRRKHRKIELDGQFEERLTAWTRIELRHGYHFHRGEVDLQKCVICRSSPEDVPPPTNPPPLSALTAEAFSIPAIIEGVLVYFKPTKYNGDVRFLITESVQPITRPFALRQVNRKFLRATDESAALRLRMGIDQKVLILRDQPPYDLGRIYYANLLWFLDFARIPIASWVTHDASHSLEIHLPRPVGTCRWLKPQDRVARAFEVSYYFVEADQAC